MISLHEDSNICICKQRFVALNYGWKNFYLWSFHISVASSVLSHTLLTETCPTEVNRRLISWWGNVLSVGQICIQEARNVFITVIICVRKF
jgi:hypothetical protein